MGRVLTVPLANKDLGRYPLITPSRLHAVRTRVEAECARHGVRLDVTLEIDAIASILDLVHCGSGYAILARHALAAPLTWSSPKWRAMRRCADLLGRGYFKRRCMSRAPVPG